MTKSIKTNRVSEILAARGIDHVRPTEEKLKELRMGITRFRRLMANESQMHPFEVEAFAKWLNVEENEIIGE